MTVVRTLRRLLVRLLAAVLGLVLVAVVGLVVWAHLGVRGAEPGPWDEVRSDPGITVRETASALVLRPGDATASTPEGTGAPSDSPLGLVLYPGAKVEAEAYAARLSPLVTEHSVTVVIAKPLLHLSLAEPRGMDAYTALVPEVGTWMVGGHSMGGVRACLAAPAADALVLLGSYCANDLSKSGVPVLSLAGSEDGLSTPQDVARARPLLPADATLVEIPGASHATFGDYGPQQGDGTASIDDAAMTEEVTTQILAFATSRGLL